MSAEFEDIEVETKNPTVLDETVQQLGAAAVIDGSFDGHTCKVRCFGNSVGFIKFSIDRQGYGQVVNP